MIPHTRPLFYLSLCENESYCLERTLCLMALEFICWSIFHFHIPFRPWLQPGGYVTWGGLNPIGTSPPPQRTPPSAALATSSNCLNSPRWRPGRGGLDAVRMMVEKILLGWGGGGFLDFSQRSKEASCHCLTPQLWTWVQPSSLDGAWSVSGISPGLKEKLECLLWSLGRIRQMFLALSFLAPYRICLYSTLFCLLPQRYLP